VRTGKRLVGTLCAVVTSRVTRLVFRFTSEAQNECRFSHPHSLLCATYFKAGHNHFVEILNFTLVHVDVFCQPNCAESCLCGPSGHAEVTQFCVCREIKHNCVHENY